MRVRALLWVLVLPLEGFWYSIDKTDDLSQYDHLVHPYLM